jgi:hypothetical protein
MWVDLTPKFFECKKFICQWCELEASIHDYKWSLDVYDIDGSPLVVELCSGRCRQSMEDDIFSAEVVES